MTENALIRVRIAPSPTGFLHLGTARTALFNYLFTRKEGGKFLVRIEDTDKVRSKPEFEKDILDGLKALGMAWDEGPDVGGDFGPYRQSEREDIYKKYLDKLIEEKKAYWCFCSEEELEVEKKAMLASGIFPKYSGKCRNLTPEEIEKNKKEKKGVIRLTVPFDLNIEFNDLIRGKVEINSKTIGDFIIAKNLETPLFLLANVIDDSLMKISHIIRGEDHISNTPKQILIYKALDFEIPKFAHLPLILNADRTKMSKRKMETSFSEYMKEGFLPEALVNFLALLGWHPEDEQEIMTLDELISKFSIKRIQKAGAAFNPEKLEWFNSQYIKKFSAQELSEKMKGIIPDKWFENKDILTRALNVEKERMKTLSDFKELAGFFFEPEDYDQELLTWKDMSSDKIVSNLDEARAAIDKVAKNRFKKENLEAELMPLAEKFGRGETLWPLRVALSGKKNSPGPFEIMEVLGKDESLRRVDLAINRTKSKLF